MKMKYGDNSKELSPWNYFTRSIFTDKSELSFISLRSIFIIADFQKIVNYHFQEKFLHKRIIPKGWNFFL